MAAMENHSEILYELLNMGEAMLLAGAEVSRVESTLSSVGRAYGLNLTVAEARLPLLTWGNGPLLHECFVWRNATPALPWKTSP